MTDLGAHDVTHRIFRHTRRLFRLMLLDLVGQPVVDCYCTLHRCLKVAGQLASRTGTVIVQQFGRTLTEVHVAAVIIHFFPRCLTGSLISGVVYSVFNITPYLVCVHLYSEL